MNDSKQEMTPSFVRDQLDEILAQEIIALIDVDSDMARMSYNLAIISCITLIVEREREIKQYQEFPPERYTKDSFFNELVDIGMERDATLENAVDTAFKSGFISRDDKGDLRAEISGYIMASFLNNMFPGMQGMNLIAYVLQINDEVLSDRKTLEEAKSNFRQTLKSRGVTVSMEHAEKNASDLAAGISKTQSQSSEISQKLKKDNLNRLARIMKKRKKKTFDSHEKLNVKDVFDKGPSREELEAQQEKIKKAEEDAKRLAKLAEELAEKNEQVKEAKEAADAAALKLKELEEREKELMAARKEAEKTQQMARELEEREARMARREEELKAMEARLYQEEKERQKQKEAREQALENEAQDHSRSDDDIESMIEAFENELTMPCPLCRDGEIVSKQTEKGKMFYSCTRDDCRFVSWDKPYHFQCPLCKNPFLTEKISENGTPGLKCPRASCSYTQDSLIDPAQVMANKASDSAPKKKKKLVRRKRRR